MKLNFKNILACAVIGMGGMGLTSCNDFLDREPITSVTPEAYFTNADQLAAYLNNYYTDALRNTNGSNLFHEQGWHGGVSRYDNDTDNYFQGGGNLGLFDPERWNVPAGQNLKGEYARVRVWNYFIRTAEDKVKNGLVGGDAALINHYIGEGYFFRAMTYFNMMARFGDLPIVDEVLVNDEGPLIEMSVRQPRNKVAKFVLDDLDKAISMLKDKGFMKNQRINKQVALLFKSRVALYEGTYEIYHEGSGRVPGDANWPGNKEHLDASITPQFFLQQAMDAAKQVADDAQLTENTHVINPKFGQIYGWNPYFEMFSQPALDKVPEVLLWREYNATLSTKHGVPNRLKDGDGAGYLRSLITSFLDKDGMPIYASTLYKGDKTLDDELANRDERLQLFCDAESTVLGSDPAEPMVADSGVVVHVDKADIIDINEEVRNKTGYRQRKYATYDWAQKSGDEILGTNAFPVFRTAEALLNYIEADYVLNKSLSATSRNYWAQLRTRAGVSTDIDATIAATDVAKEAEHQDLGAYSGNTMVDATLYNIRRERRCEFIGEGMRWDDLIRWRSFDRMIGGAHKFIPEGFNLWDEAYKLYPSVDNHEKGEAYLRADNSTEANCSPASVSKYLRPLQRWETNNDLYNGYSWMDAYYLQPIGIQEIELSRGNLYQNPNWPTEAGHALK